MPSTFEIHQLFSIHIKSQLIENLSTGFYNLVIKGELINQNVVCY